MSQVVYDKPSAPLLPRARALVARACDFLLPPRCLLCGEPGADGRDMCAACHARLPVNRHGCPRCAVPVVIPGICDRCQRQAPLLEASYGAFLYRYPLDRLVQRFKFRQDLSAGRLMADLMLPCVARADRPDALVPVPLHRSRLRRRGYDQALELARPLAARLELPLDPGLLCRHRATSAQSELDALARRRNLRGAFSVRRQGPLPRHVALVDDVMTTGATLGAAALALRRAGVERVDAWVCARTWQTCWEWPPTSIDPIGSG